MANKFLHVPKLNDGTEQIHAYSLSATNLEENKALKTDNSRQLYSTDLEISDITGLSTSLSGKVDNPFTENVDGGGYNLTNVGTLEADNLNVKVQLETKDPLVEFNTDNTANQNLGWYALDGSSNTSGVMFSKDDNHLKIVQGMTSSLSSTTPGTTLDTSLGTIDTQNCNIKSTLTIGDGTDYTLPTIRGTAGQCLELTDGSGTVGWVNNSGTISVQADSVLGNDNSLVKVDGNSTRKIKSSSIIIDGSENMSGVNNITSSGVITINDTTASTSTDSGSLIVSGGVGIAKNMMVGTTLDVGGVIYTNDTTESSSTSTGALKVSGGVGVAKKLYVGGESTFSSNILVSTAPTLGNHLTNKTYVDGAISSGCSDCITSDAVFGSDNVIVRSDGSDRKSQSTGVTIDDSDNISGIGSLTSSGAITVNDTTASTSTDSGSLIVSGGVGIAKNMMVGTTLDVGGVIYTNDTTESTSTSTGALKVSGGVGVAKKLYVGGESTFSSNILLNTAPTLGDHLTNKTYVDGAISSGCSDCITSDAVFGTDNVLIKSDGTSRKSQSTGISVSDTNNITGVNNLTSNGTITISDTTDSTSTSTGSLIIGGGVGIAKKLYVGDSLKVKAIATMENTLDSSGTNSGSLITSGGLGVAKKANIGGITTVSDTTQSSATNTGALVVEGGVGIAKKLYVGDEATFSSNILLNTAPTLGDHLTNKTYVDSVAGSPTQAILSSSTIGSNNIVKGSNGTRYVTASNISIDGSDNITGVVGMTSSGVNNITNTTQSSATNNGALIVSGGVGIAKTLRVGENVHATDLTLSGNAIVSTAPTIGNHLTNKTYVDGTISSSLTNYVQSSSTFGTDNRLLKSDGTSRNCQSTGISIDDSDNITGVNNITSDGVITVSDTTNTSSTSTGALIVSGGVGIAKALQVGSSIKNYGTLTVDNTTESSSTVTGALIVSGGLGIGKKAYIGGITRVEDTTESTATNTGSLIVSGGLGVAKNLHSQAITCTGVDATSGNVSGVDIVSSGNIKSNSGSGDFIQIVGDKISQQGTGTLELELIDNKASALDILDSGATSFIKIDTTDVANKIHMLQPLYTRDIYLDYDGGNKGILFETNSGSNTMKLIASASQTSDYVLTLPVDDGTSDQVLKTNGSGVLSWTDQTSGSTQVYGELWSQTQYDRTLTSNTWAEVLNTTTLGTSSDFDESANGRLRYTGSTTKTFFIVATLSVEAQEEEQVNGFQIRKNGTVNTKSTKERLAWSGDIYEVSLSSILSLAQNDYISIWCNDANSTGEDLYFNQTMLTAISLS